MNELISNSWIQGGAILVLIVMLFYFARLMFKNQQNILERSLNEVKSVRDEMQQYTKDCNKILLTQNAEHHVILKRLTIVLKRVLIKDEK